jgi:type I restriction enzyme M protein
METRVHKVFDPDDILKVAGTYHAWRSRDGQYQDVAGFCMSASTEVIAGHDFVLTPGRYVGAEDVEEDGEGFEEKMGGLVAALKAQTEQSGLLDEKIRLALGTIGYGY